MPEFTSHIQGTPSWAELTTSDYQGALTFYSALFGWEDEANEMSPGMYYHMQKLRGLEVAALYQQGVEEKQQGVPPYWKVYFTVDDIRKSSAQAKESGVSVIFGTMEASALVMRCSSRLPGRRVGLMTVQRLHRARIKVKRWPPSGTN